MDYESLTTDEQSQILEQRKKQYEAEHFNHSVNKELLVASGVTDEQTIAAIKTADEAMKTLDAAYAATKIKLDKLNKTKTPK